MLVAEADREALKAWIIPKLEKISDADADVLADYVIALVIAEPTEDSARKNCLESLPDFLHDNTTTFTNEVLRAVKTQSFLPHAKSTAPAIPSAPALLPSPALSAEAKPFNPPTGPFNPPTGPSSTRLPGLGSDLTNGRGEQSRKRRYNERETSQPRDGQDPHYRRGGDRPFKQAARRGGRQNRGGFGGPDLNGAAMYGTNGAPAAMPPTFPALSNLPEGLPPLDPTNPMSFLTMMGMMFPQVLSNLPQAAPPLNGAPPDTHRRKKTKGRKGRCRDYDTKGYCALGSACPYEHGGEVVMSNTADEYDPTRSSLAVEDRSSNSRNPTEKRGRARPPGRTRAPFSQAGPTSDRSNTTIVVEQIPEEHFSEEAVRRFFSQFGNILEVDMQAYKRLAIVKYDDHFAARRAYDSPKVIFDNRFVKVYWYNPDTVPEPPVKDMSETHQQDEEMLDPEEVERRQAEAQKAYEERQKKAQEADARAEEVERKLREREEEMRILREKLAKKGGSKESAALIDQLSSLQAEAQDLNGFEYPEYAPRGRGRGGYRGRGFYAPRGRGYSSYRGGYSGRGFAGAPFAGARTGVKRLDNRPKRIAVSGVEPGSQLDETLREHLLSRYDFESIDPHPEKTDTQIITFKERYVADMFLDNSSEIPGIDKMELTWVPNATTVVKSEPTSDQPGHLTSDADTKMDETKDEPSESAVANGVGDHNASANGGEADLDVADDEDRWMGA